MPPPTLNSEEPEKFQRESKSVRRVRLQNTYEIATTLRLMPK